MVQTTFNSNLGEMETSVTDTQTESFEVSVCLSVAEVSVCVSVAQVSITAGLLGEGLLHGSHVYRAADDY